MDSTPKVSFVIPCLNSEQYIEDCLLSIIAQKVDDFEVIVVDNGSNDSTIDIVKTLANRDGRIKLIECDYKCQSKAKNLGIYKAHGKYLCFVDSDDTVSNDLIESYPIDRDFDFYISNWNKITRNKSSSKKLLLNEGKLSKGDLKIMQEWVIGGVKSKNPMDIDMFSSNCGRLYKRDIFVQHNIRFCPMKEIGGSEDVLVNYEFFEYAKNGYYVNKSLYNYFSRPTSYTHNKSFENLLLIFNQFKAIESLITRLNKYDIHYRLLCNRVLITSLPVFIVTSRLTLYKKNEKTKFVKEYISRADFKKYIQLADYRNFAFPFRVFYWLITKGYYKMAYNMVRVITKIRK